jgi:hypothetical protein
MAWAGAVGALVVAGACGHTDQNVDTAKLVAAHSVDSGAAPAAHVERKPPLGGPSIVVDSTAREPHLEIKGTDYVF